LYFIKKILQQRISVILSLIGDRIFAKILKNAFFNRNISIFLPMDPDSQYGSGYTKSQNPDPIRIRIHNPAKLLQIFVFLKNVTDTS
jgi:hypothetical protein